MDVNNIGNNIGEMFKEETIKHSKTGEKLQTKKDGIERAKELLKTLDLQDEVETSKSKLREIIQCLYVGRGLENQMNYLNAKRTSHDVITQGYYIVASKQQYLSDALDELENEFNGL